MKIKNLKIELSKVKRFTNISYKLEQYMTPAELAAHAIFCIHSEYDDIEGKIVMDLCCGTGILAIGCSFFGPKYLMAVDVDKEALDVCKENLINFEVECDLIRSDFNKFSMFSDMVDTVIMNPPFGTKIKHQDVKALDKALSIAKVVYSMHKKSTRDYFLKKYPSSKVVAQMKYDLPRTYDFHKSKNKVIEVDLIRFTRT
ncbi:Methyltransferase-like protein 5 [Nosema granulosis]|uniref:Methyltransferase-like protein 5 n=1 Tax=Nosema granulosis TaxID=83296 RepID=A0A9P6H0D2_9MICR|nr:Methyltransferase-like protein 5 [Nosema granulosis]